MSDWAEIEKISIACWFAFCAGAMYGAWATRRVQNETKRITTAKRLQSR